MKKIDLILKVTDACNLRCKYCYNSEKKYVNNIMSLDRFAKLLELLHADYSVVHVIWHGGEPLTAGLDFYRQALDEERKAAMVSNLLVVLCGNKDAQPIVNSGSIY